MPATDRSSTPIHSWALGIRDITEAHIVQGYHPDPEFVPVYAANHVRAVADWVYAEIKRCGRPYRVNSEFNQWFGKAEMFDVLKQDDLLPLREGMTPAERQAFDRWLPTIFWE